MMYREGTLAFDLFVERATDGVPNDGQYHVRFRGEIVGSFKSKKKAVDLYRLKRKELLEAGMKVPTAEIPTKQELLLKLRAEGDIRALRSEWLAGIFEDQGSKKAVGVGAAASDSWRYVRRSGTGEHRIYR